MLRIDDELSNVKRVAITGHIRPDGDCVGATMALYNYIRDNYPEIEAKVLLEEPEAHFGFMRGFDEIVTAQASLGHFDLFVVLDVGELDRIAVFTHHYFKDADRRICIDHHIKNAAIGDVNIIKPEISSACEVLYEMLDEGKVSKETAECLYTGIIHDTGVFKYQSVTKRTMEIAGTLMEKGIDWTNIIDDTFFRKTFTQNILMGKGLIDAKIALDGKVIYSYLPKSILEEYHVPGRDLGGIIDQLRFTKGIEIAIFAYGMADKKIKVSLRSVNYANVNDIATVFGGGGHAKAAGLTVETDNFDELLERILAEAAKQLR